jgi:opacity protein-like surface antigen
MKNILTMTALLCIAAGARADGWYDNGWYIGFGLGGVRTADASENIDAHHTALARYGINDITSHDTTSSATSLLGGYRFNKFLAAELAYTDLGDYDMRGFSGPAQTLPAGRERDRVSALSLSAVATAPIGDVFAIYGKIGPVLATVEERTCVSNLFFCDSSSDTNDAWLGGVGLRLTPPTLIGEIRLEYNRYGDIRDGSEFTAGDFNLWQVEYVYSFSE